MMSYVHPLLTCERNFLPPSVLGLSLLVLSLLFFCRLLASAGVCCRLAPSSTIGAIKWTCILILQPLLFALRGTLSSDGA